LASCFSRKKDRKQKRKAALRQQRQAASAAAADAQAAAASSSLSAGAAQAPPSPAGGEQHELIINRGVRVGPALSEEQQERIEQVRLRRQRLQRRIPEQETEISRGAYYEAIGARSAQQRLEQAKLLSQKGRAAVLAADAMSRHSLATADLESFKQAVGALLAALPALSEFYDSRNARRRRFDSLQAEASAMAAYVRAIAPDPETVIVIGAAAFPSSGRGAPASPTTKLVRKFSKFRRVVALPEPFTTSRCSVCQDVNSITHLVIGADQWPVHGLRQCPHCGAILARDLSATRNIGTAAVSVWLFGSWPAYLHKSTYDSRQLHAQQLGPVPIASLPRRHASSTSNESPHNQG
jgi:hypothetical protein